MNDQMSWFETETDKKFEDLPEGEYSATLTNVTLKETKEFPSLSIEFTLASKRKVWLNVSFKETMKWKVSQTMQDIGIYDRAKSIVMSGKPIAHAFLDAAGELIGAVCEIEVSYSDWKGKRWQDCKVLAVSGAMTSPSAKVTTTAGRQPSTTAGVKNHAIAKQSAPPQVNANEDLPDFMR